MNEIEAYKIISNFSYFKSDDLKKIIGSERMTYVYLKRWINQKKIVKLPFFFYSPIDQDTGKYKANLLEVACEIEKDAFLCGVTACKIHGLQVPETNRIYVVTKKSFNVKEFDGWIFKPRFMTDIFGIVKKDKIRYTDYTRTVIEMIRDFDKYMSLIEFLTFLKSVNTLDSREVNKVLEILDSKIVFQKIGWLIDTGLLNVDKPDYLIEFCRRNIGNSRRFFCKKAKNEGKYNPKWQMVLPKEIKV
ncbi:MAG: hypothetical protein SCJ93_08685 [Bacillota bacterium]|nr:hypothetical protein [Bacillota bacterium]